MRLRFHVRHLTGLHGAVQAVVSATSSWVVGRTLAALRSYGSPAVPSWAVRGAPNPSPRF